MGCPGSEVEELRLVMGELEMGGSGDGGRSCRCRGWPVEEANGDVEVVRGSLAMKPCTVMTGGRQRNIIG